ncbi:MAG: Tol-Pal system beta propeller repeat protein TolB [Thermoanaerobaculia bacterium]|nr:Tol-Pal system beta propeller repeat protein TolB [Thermoanaerobaculia bacterium]
MIRLRPPTPLFSLFLGILLLAPSLGSQEVPPREPAAQEEGDDVTLVIEEGQTARIRLAFPEPEIRGDLSPEAREARRELESALRSDLQSTGIFQIQGPEALSVVEPTGDRGRDFEQYRSLGNEAVLLAEIYQEGSDRIVLEGRVYDLASGQSILGKRYRGSFDLARRIAHTFTDEIVLYFTGRRGIALTSIAFVSDRSGEKEIYLMDYDGRNVRPITGHQSISMAPDWSPSGNAVAYVSYYGGFPGIYLVNLETGEKEPVITEGSLNSAPDFSGDGSHLVFSRSLAGNTEIFSVARDGSDLRRLTRSPGIDTNPSWSPSGRQIAFTSSRAGNPHIYVMDAEGTNLQRITFEGTYNDGAAWSPDGSKIAYATRRRGRQFDIAVTDLALMETKVLTRRMAGSQESPTWSPDGRRIAFASAVGGRTQIRVVPAEGGESELLTADGNNMAPDWSGHPN